jgi:putative transposase
VSQFSTAFLTSRFSSALYTIESQDEAKRRADYAIAVMEATRFIRSIKEASKAINKCFKKRKDKKKPSLRSVRRWIQRYISSGDSIRSLVTNNMSKGFRGPRDPDLEVIINSVIDIHISKKSSMFNDFRSAVVTKIAEQNEIRKEYHKKLIAIPTEKLLRSRLKNIDPQYFIRNRFGEKVEAKIFKIIGSRKGPNRANQIWEADHTILDVFVLHDDYFLPIGKPRITGMIDVYTRCICGVYISFDPAGYNSVMHFLNNAVQTKEYIRTRFPEK